MPATPNSTILALDVGGKRIGVAVASRAAGIASPLTTLAHSDSIIKDIQTVIVHEAADTVVVGLPRGLDGQSTAQTAEVEAFAEQLRQAITQPVHFQDEALTSQKAESELQARGKDYRREDIDALAATYILEDYLAEARGEQHGV